MTTSIDKAIDKPVGDAFVRRSSAWRALHLLPLWFMASIVLVTYAAIGWTLRRGFDWTDEAFVYTMIASNRMAVGEAWGFQHLLHPIYVLTGESVLAFRVLRLAGYLLLSVALVVCARAVVRRLGISIPRPGWTLTFLLAQVGTFLAWSYPPRYIGYNELGSWFAQLGVGLILLSLATGFSPPDDRRASMVMWGVWSGLGAIITLLVFAKVTSAMVFGAVLAPVIVIPNPALRWWKRVVAIAGGGSAVLALLWISGCPIAFYLRNARGLLFDKSTRDAFGHPLSPMISAYTASVSLTFRVLVPALILFTLMALTIRWRAKAADGDERRSLDRVLDAIRWVLGVLLVVAVVLLPRVNDALAPPSLLSWSYLGELTALLGAAAIIGLLILGTSGWTAPGSSLRRPLSIALGAAVIVAAPFISALGTSNPIMGQLMWTATLWAVALGVVLVLMTQQLAVRRSGAVILPSLVSCALLLMAAVAVKEHVAAPYRTAPLLTQETSTSVPELHGLLLTDDDAAWVDWVAAAGVSLQAHDVPAIAIATRVNTVFTSSGALYAFNHSGYANPWLGIDWPAAYNSLRVACNRDRPSGLFVLQPGTSTARSRSTVDVTRNLAACGIRFPGDFKVVARRAAKNPAFAMTIWQLKN